MPEPQQESLYQKLIEHPNANKTQLFSMAIKSNKLALIEQLAKSTHDFAYTEKTELPKGVVEQLISLIQQEQITPARALKLVPNHKTIFLAAFNKDPSCISTVSADLVKAVYEASKDPLLLKYATKNQLLSLIKATKNPTTLIAAIDPKLIVELINENKFTTKELEACSKALNSNEAVILAAFNKNPKVLANASVDLMLTLIEKEAISAEKACQVFATNEKVVSAAVQHKPAALSFVQAPMVIKLLESNITSAEEVCSTFPNNEQLVLEAYKHRPKALEALPFEGLVERLVKKGQISAQDAFAVYPEQEGLAKAIACSKQLAEMTALQVTGNHAHYAERAQQLKELYLKNKDYPLASTDQQLTKLVKNLCDVLVEELKKQSLPVSKETSQSIKRLNGDKLIALMQDLAKRNEQAQPKELISMAEANVDEEEKFDPVQDAKQVLSAILKAQVGTKDIFITAYCSLKRRELEQCQHKPEKVNVLLAGLKKTYEAVNSPEMQAIKLALDNLANGKKTTLFGGHKGVDPAIAKINRLETALCKVPLPERLNICSNANSEQCVQVQKILATLKPTEFSLPSTEPMIATRGTV
ncbi:hypothetical protein [Legionella sp. km772]|uniref:hypothetical protein n=1 Tax=Legionella sp. km772 TaxID=2498111 RepID=UPI000F8F7FB3|nr:hypothetical protein [Legionella sp. km772]RUR09287.1 hypothetical protein ELY15_09480 [Legionella sp. km772]